MNSHLKSTMLAVALLASLVGLAACAKYPTVVKSAETTPAAASATPTR